MDLSEPFHAVGKFLVALKRRSFFPAIAISIIALPATVLVLGFPTESANVNDPLLPAEEEIRLGSFPVVEPHVRFGFALDTFLVLESEIKRGQYLGELLHDYGVDYASIDQLATNAEEVFNVKNLRQGKPYFILTKDDSQPADYFIYEPSVYEYVVFHLKNDLKVERFKREVNTEIKSTGGTIESSLWNAMIDNGLSFEITDKMEDALQWSIDFYHLQKGDQFKLVYDQNFIKDEEVGVGKLHAAYYKRDDQEYYAIYYENTQHKGYYDLEGRPMKSSFLKSPVKYSRISSHYNLNRFHPILKRVRPHLGTDYAAPYGTPINAVGNGVITEASYTKGNGNYIKIRHDDTYETQYLHMQNFAKSIRPGVHVKQGQVIGYVGSTGLATGPHVCFRFWKNGRQINHLKLSFPPPEPLPDADMPAFLEVRDSLLNLLKQTPVKAAREEFVAEYLDETGEIRTGNP